MRTPISALALALILVAPLPGAADEVIFLNGDRLTGKIRSAAGGKLVLETEAAGNVTIDLAKVRTFSTDAPIQVQVGDTMLSAPVAAGSDGQVRTQMTPGTPPQPLAIADIKAINPPEPAWKGSVKLTGLYTTGNSETEQLGFTARLGKRWERDRFDAGAEYSYGRQENRDTGERSTTTDFAAASMKYDHFFTPKFYSYGSLKAERDGVADLTLRFTPSAGVGYQWFEGPAFNLRTEAGVAWVYEDYDSSGSRDFFSGRFAYAVDWTPNPTLTLFHTLEYLPSLDDFTGDYLLNADAGLRARMWKRLFAEFKAEYRYDATPAPGRENADTRYLLGLGWEF